MEKSRVNNAIENYKNGFNCCQAVVCEYSDLVGMDKKTAFRVSEIFGTGISGMADTCGSVCAMLIIASLKNSDGNLEAPKSKIDTYKLGRKLCEEFKKMNTSIICKELRGNKETGKIRSCRGCVADSAILIEKYLFPGKFEEYTDNVE